jgi:hypothetical protein
MNASCQYFLYFMYWPIMKRFGEKLRQCDGISLGRLAALLGHASHSLVTSLERRSERKSSVELVIR